jgi:hypothetical protein
VAKLPALEQPKLDDLTQVDNLITKVVNLETPSLTALQRPLQPLQPLYRSILKNYYYPPPLSPPQGYGGRRGKNKK